MDGDAISPPRHLLWCYYIVRCPILLPMCMEMPNGGQQNFMPSYKDRCNRGLFKPGENVRLAVRGCMKSVFVSLMCLRWCYKGLGTMLAMPKTFHAPTYLHIPAHESHSGQGYGSTKDDSQRLWKVPKAHTYWLSEICIVCSRTTLNTRHRVLGVLCSLAMHMSTYLLSACLILLMPLLVSGYRSLLKLHCVITKNRC